MKFTNTKLFLPILTVLGILLAVYLYPIYQRPAEPIHTTLPNDSQTSQNESPRIISTKPEPLEEAVVSANEVVEITFNRPLENSGEFKLRIDPGIDFKIELSGDRKTAKIIPVEPFELGKTYTIFIGTETKFDGVGRWGEEKIFHIKTIPYKGV